VQGFGGNCCVADVSYVLSDTHRSWENEFLARWLRFIVRAIR
jgi:hypothetical protein